MKHRPNGFSLVELLIVVGIILIMAAIAIPNFLRARMAANESSAGSNIRTINTAEVSYFATYPTVGFATLPSLGSGTTTPCVPVSTQGCFIDNFLATSAGTGNGKDGYLFTLTATASAYTSDAEPVSANTGSRAFCSNQTGVIYYLAPNTCTPATGAPLQ